ncbi:MAG: envelope stress response membrane protein PspB [Gammaproteobacteria bacterium]|nr:envelope stress response membrane protein PspB [Gammaproteobacteria bacterium]
MGEELLVIPILFLTIVVPLWLVLHYVAKFKSAKSLSSSDEEALAELWHQADKFESRIESLETILDEEVPGWRSQS